MNTIPLYGLADSAKPPLLPRNPRTEIPSGRKLSTHDQGEESLVCSASRVRRLDDVGELHTHQHPHLPGRRRSGRLLIASAAGTNPSARRMPASPTTYFEGLRASS